MSTKEEEAINNFYTLKSKYEKKYNNHLKKIRESDLSMGKKKKKMKNLKIKCVGKKCKSTHGTRFEIKKTKLIAYCGDTENPCGLKIDIFRGTYLYLPKILLDIESNLEDVKVEIIQLKLELLFGLSTEEQISENFTTLKEKYLELGAIVSNLNSMIINNNMIVTQPSISEENKKTARDELIRLDNIKLLNLINVFRSIIKEAQQETAISSRQYFSDAIREYIDKIIPLLQNIRKTNYEIQTVVDVGNGKFRLVQIKNTLDKNQVELGPPEIITNNK